MAAGLTRLSSVIAAAVFGLRAPYAVAQCVRPPALCCLRISLQNHPGNCSDFVRQAGVPPALRPACPPSPGLRAGSQRPRSLRFRRAAPPTCAVARHSPGWLSVVLWRRPFSSCTGCLSYLRGRIPARSTAKPPPAPRLRLWQVEPAAVAFQPRGTIWTSVGTTTPGTPSSLGVTASSNGLVFAATNSYMCFPSTTAPSGASTFSGWVAIGGSTIVIPPTSGTGSVLWALLPGGSCSTTVTSFSSSNIIYIAPGSSNPTVFTPTPGAVFSTFSSASLLGSTPTWFHLAYTIPSPAAPMTLYVNGASVGQSTASVSFSGATGSLWLGNTPSWDGSKLNGLACVPALAFPSVSDPPGCIRLHRICPSRALLLLVDHPPTHLMPLLDATCF